MPDVTPFRFFFSLAVLALIFSTIKLVDYFLGLRRVRLKLSETSVLLHLFAVAYFWFVMVPILVVLDENPAWYANDSLLWSRLGTWLAMIASFIAHAIDLSSGDAAPPPESQPLPVPAPPPQPTNPPFLETALEKQMYPPTIKPHVIKLLRSYLAQLTEPLSSEKLSSILTTVSLIGHSMPKIAVYSQHGQPLIDHAHYRYFSDLPKPLSDALANIPVKLVIPDNLRTTHHQIVSSSGHGKTTLIQSMILDDLEEDASIIVIDSQNRMINELAQVIPMDRLVLVDPEYCPPALNIFAGAGTDERSVANSLQLYEYIFSALEAGMTSKQTLVYRYLSRLCMVIPGANLTTMLSMLKPGGIEPYADDIPQLGQTGTAFFHEFMQPKNQYNETRLEVQRRLFTVLESTTFTKMLGAAENKLDLARLIDQGKVVLISTNKELLKGNAALLGRIFLAQVMQAVMSRKSSQKRVYLYVDEFKDYAEDSDILLDLFSQSRKYNLALIVAHQELSQLTPKLAATMSTNTSIKMVGGVSHEDAERMAKQIKCEPYQLENLPVGTFMAWFKGYGTYRWTVDLSRFGREPKANSLAHVHQVMRSRYGDGQPSAPPSAQPAPKYPQSVSEPGMYIVQGANKGKLLNDTDEESSPW